MYHEMGALIPPTGKKPRFTAVYIHDTENAVPNRRHFYSLLRDGLLGRLANMLHENNKLVQMFVSLRDLMNSNQISEDVELVIHAHERTKQSHERKCNTPEASEVAALIVGEQYGAIDIVLRRKGRIDAKGFEKNRCNSTGKSQVRSIVLSLALFARQWRLKFKAHAPGFERKAPKGHSSKVLFPLTVSTRV